MTDELMGDIINEVQHHGDTSSAMYAVALHLIELAKLNLEHKLNILIFAGIIYADSTKSGALSCPDFLQEEFKQTAVRAFFV